MRRSALVVAAATLMATSASAQAPAPTVAPAASGVPPSARTAPSAAAERLPEGHPPVRDPHAGALPGSFRPPADEDGPDPALPRGTLRVEVRDERSSPVPGTPIRLAILHQTVAAGERRDYRDGVTGADGAAIFSALEGGSAYSYRVTATRGAATYASQPLNLMGAVGHRVVLHVFPATRSVKEALVGTRGSVSVVPREDVFHFEVAFRFFNVGAISWVPDGATLALPAGWKGFGTEEGMSDVRFVRDGERGARLEGTISPGQHDAAFRFQVPSPHAPSVSFSLELPPHVMQMTVAAAAVPGMELAVEGFPAATKDESNRKILRSDRVLRPGDPEMKRIVVTLSGLPTPSSGRWWATGLAAALAVAGAFAASRAPGSRREAAADTSAARERLLDELVELERAHRTGAVGPKTYARTRGALLAALTRVVTAERGSAPAGAAFPDRPKTKKTLRNS